MSRYSVSVNPTQITVNIGLARRAVSYPRAYVHDIPNGAQELAISFNTALTGLASDYCHPICQIVNTVDNFPRDLTWRIKAFSVNGFTVRLSAPTDSGNYKISWAIAQRLFP